jgi:hypothetical protein
VVLKPLAELILGEPSGSLTAFDPVLSLVQWAAESADPQVYDALVTGGAESNRNVFMVQGIVDHYILPRIANATSASLGLDLAGAPLDNNPAYVDQMQVMQVLPLVGRGQISQPASGNVPPATLVLVQQPGDALEDGHEVIFQTDPPKHQYRCYLQTWLSGTPVIYPDGAAEDPCP